MAFGHDLIASLPESLCEALRDPFDSRAVVFALVLDRDPAQAQQQRALIKSQVDPLVWATFQRLCPLVLDLPKTAALELVSLALPALMQMAQTQASEFLRSQDALIESDDEVTVYEYALRHVVHIGLNREWAQARGRARNDDLHQLLMVVAAIGAPDDDQAAAAAYVVAAKACRKEVSPSAFKRQRTTDWRQLDLALRRLATVKPKHKR